MKRAALFGGMMLRRSYLYDCPLSVVTVFAPTSIAVIFWLVTYSI